MKVLIALMVFSLVSAVRSTIAEDKIATIKSEVLCGDGLDRATCRFDQEMLRASLARLRLAPTSWRWIVVAPDHWHSIASQLHIADSVPAFSSLSLRSTWIHQSFFAMDDRIDEHLQAYVSLIGPARLDWVVAHELGHILCNTTSERRAESAGGRLRFGSADERKLCR